MSAEEDTGATITPPERLAIGISFGNSYSSIAHTSSDGKAIVIANEDGDRQIPSVLSYIDGEEYHGVQAKGQLVRNSANTVAYFRDFLGKDFESIDPSPCHESAHAQKHGETVAFSINDKSSETPSTVTVSDIATRHIRRLASSASDFLGSKVNAAVFTVPTNLSDAQKKALGEAAKNADIEVLQFIAEPVAAILAYDARAETKVTDKIILVADLGGTRSDVALVASRGGMYSVLATAHDYEFCGTKLDAVLIDYFAKDFIKKHKIDPREDKRGLAKLKLESEATKKALSIGTNATISIESLANGIDYSSTINRTRYELLANKIFGGVSRLVEGVVKKAGLDVLDIDEIVLAGGTSHTPKIATNLASIFPAPTKIIAPATDSNAINPAELIVRGAAIQASLVQDFDTEDIEQSAHPMITATPHLRYAVGVLMISETLEQGIFTPILPADTAVPARRTLVCAAPKAGGDVIVKLCEGERAIKITKSEPKAKENGKPEKKEGGDEDDSDEDLSSDEEEEKREKVWKPGQVLAEAAVRGIKKGGKVEVTVNVNAELKVEFTAREVGASGGVRGVLEKPAKAVA